MINQTKFHPGAVLPHAHPMILLDEIISFDQNSVVARVTPTTAKPFANEQGDVPGWVGIEYMAQAIGAYAGIQAQLCGDPVKVGFLLGSRAYDVSVRQFDNQRGYDVFATKVYDDDGLSAFDCTICMAGDNQVLATATINTFQPDNLDEFLETGNA